MEREKLRRLERERAEAEHRERLSKKAQQDSDPLKSKFVSLLKVPLRRPKVFSRDIGRAM